MDKVDKVVMEANNNMDKAAKVGMEANKLMVKVKVDTEANKLMVKVKVDTEANNNMVKVVKVAMEANKEDNNMDKVANMGNNNQVMVSKEVNSMGNKEDNTEDNMEDNNKVDMVETKDGENDLF